MRTQDPLVRAKLQFFRYLFDGKDDDIKQVSSMVIKDPNLHLEHHHKCLPLQVAIQEKNEKLIQVLALKLRNSDVHAFFISNYNRLILDFSIRLDDAPTIRTLLVMGVIKVEKPLTISENFLFHAVRLGAVQASKALWTLKADLFLQKPVDGNPFHWSASLKHPKVLEMFIQENRKLPKEKQLDINFSTPQLPTPLEVALMTEDPSEEIIQLLISNGAHFDQTGEGRKATAIQNMLRSFPNPTVLRILLKNGAKISRSSINDLDLISRTIFLADRFFKTPLEKRFRETVQELLKENENRKFTSDYVRTSADAETLEYLQKLAFHGHLGFYVLLSSEISDPAYLDVFLYNPEQVPSISLNYWSRLTELFIGSKRIDHLNYILRHHKTRIKTNTAMKESAFELAIDKRNQETIEILLNQGLVPSPSIVKKAFDNDLYDIAKLILSTKKVDLSKVFELEKDFSQYCFNRPQAFQILLSGGYINVNRPIENSLTILQSAIQSKKIDFAIQIIEDIKTEIKPLDDDQMAPLILSLKGNHKELTRIIVSRSPEKLPELVSKLKTNHPDLAQNLLDETRDYFMEMIQSLSPAQTPQQKASGSKPVTAQQEKQLIKKKFKELDIASGSLEKKIEWQIQFADLLLEQYLTHQTLLAGKFSESLYQKLLLDEDFETNSPRYQHVLVQLFKYLTSKGSSDRASPNYDEDTQYSLLEKILHIFQKISQPETELETMQNYIKTNHPELSQQVTFSNWNPSDPAPFLTQIMRRLGQCQIEKTHLLREKEAAEGRRLKTEIAFNQLKGQQTQLQAQYLQCELENTRLKEQIAQLTRLRSNSAGNLSGTTSTDPRSTTATSLSRNELSSVSSARTESPPSSVYPSNENDSEDSPNDEEDEKSRHLGSSLSPIGNVKNHKKPPFIDNPWTIDGPSESEVDSESLNDTERANYDRLIEQLKICGPKLIGFPDKSTLNFGRMKRSNKNEWHMHLSGAHKKTVHWVFSEQDHTIKIIHLGNHQ